MTTPPDHPPSVLPPCSACAVAGLCPVGQRPPVWGDAVRRLMRTATFKSGEVLLAEGETAQGFRFIKTGLVLLRQTGPDQVMRPIGLVGRGYMTGLLGLNGLPSLLRFEAASLVSVCEVSHHDLRRLQALEGEAAATLMAFNRKAFEVLTGWSQIMRMRSLAPRLAAALGLLVQLQGSTRVRLPGHRLLAELLAVTRESVSRSLEELAAAGVVTRLGRGTVDVNTEVLNAWMTAKTSTKAT